MSDANASGVMGVAGRYLSRLKFSQLFVLTAVLFVADLFLPDPIPFADELLLLLLTLLFGSWKKKRQEPLPKPPPKNVTPPA